MLLSLLLACQDYAINEKMQGEPIIAPDFIDFGHLRSGQETGLRQIIFSNGGNAPLHVDYIEIEGERFDVDTSGFTVEPLSWHALDLTYIPETSYCNTLLFVLKINNTKYTYQCLLGILNSKLIGWYFRKKFQISADDTFPQIMIRDIQQFPIPEPISVNSKQEELSSKVEQILNLHRQLLKAKTPQSKTVIQRQIDNTDGQIDELVYELYDLTKEEIEIVESSVV